MAEAIIPREGYRPLLVLLAGLALVSVLFMVVNAHGHWDFVLPLRARKWAALALVGCAVAVAAVLFQTASQNPILTPSIMGFDALYVMLQSLLMFFMGARWASALDPRLMFGVQVLAMLVFSRLLYRLLFRSSQRDLHLLVLAGVVLGILFRSLSVFLQRLMNPNEFSYLQDRFFASFNNPDQHLLLLAALLLLGALVAAWRLLPACDVLVLGREAAIGLGVDHHRTVSRILMIVALLTAVATALVGPVTFLGLLASHLTYRLLRTARHAILLPAAALIAVICLVGGQLLFEHLLAFEVNLRIIIDFVGGLLFIALLVRQTR